MAAIIYDERNELLNVTRTQGSALSAIDHENQKLGIPRSKAQSQLDKEEADRMYFKEYVGQGIGRAEEIRRDRLIEKARVDSDKDLEERQ